VQDRKLKIEYVPISKLKGWTKNPRNNDDAAERLSGLIEEHGFINPVIATPDGTVRAGHTRIKAAELKGIEKVPVIYVEFDSEAKAEAFSIADNRAGEWAQWDYKKLAQILLDLDTGEFDMELTGFNPDEIEDLIAEYGDRPIQEEEDFNPEEEAAKIEEPVSKTGDIWCLGKHRVICGDATSSRDVSALLDSKTADMLLTDPPYNVDYVGKTADALTIDNDDMNDQQFHDFILSALTNARSVLKAGGPFYIFHADTKGLIFRTATAEAGLTLKQVLVWVKNTIVMGRQDYHWQHEPILYGWKEGEAHCWFGFRDKSTVYDEGLPDIDAMKKDELRAYIKDLLNQLQTTVTRDDKPTRSTEHPTMKPLPLLRHYMENSSRSDNIVFDPFLGSGSTLIAAEQLGRICYGMELSPVYTDVIVKRYLKFRDSDVGVRLIRNGKERHISDVKEWKVV
jgi:DNA modification methylase